MQTKENTITKKWNSYTGARKINILLILVALLSLGLVPVFAATSNVECRINFSIDMSFSVAHTSHGGNHANAQQMRSAINAAITDVSASFPKAKFSFTLFSSKAGNYVGSGGYWVAPATATSYVNSFKWSNEPGSSLSSLPYKLAPSGAEGGTNWQEALNVQNTTITGQANPNGIIFITDGNPTTDTAEMAYRAANGSGSVPNIFDEGDPNVNPTKTHLNAAISSFQQNVARGITTFGLGIIGQNPEDSTYSLTWGKENIQKVSNPGRVFTDYSAMAPNLKEYAQSICTKQIPPVTTTPPPSKGFVWTSTHPVALNADGTYAGPDMTKSLGGFTYSVPGATDSSQTGKVATRPASTGNFLVDLQALLTSGYLQNYVVDLNKTYSVTQSGGDGVNTIAFDRYCETPSSTNLKGTYPGANPAANPISTGSVTTIKYCRFVQATAGIQLNKTVSKVLKADGSLRTDKTIAYKGDTVVYSFTVKNTGTAPLNNIKITDTSLPGGSFSDTITTKLLPNKTANATKTFSYVVPQTVTLGSDLKNVAKVTADALNAKNVKAGTATDSDDAVVKINSGTISISKVGPGVILPGGTGKYSITITNSGAAALVNVPWKDDTLKALKDNGTITTTSALSGTIPSLAIGASVTKDINVTFTSDATKFNAAFVNGEFTNKATACVEGTIGCVDDTYVTPTAKIELDKSGPVSVIPGETYTYTFVVKNVGKTDLTNIVINDPDIEKLTGKKATITLTNITLKPGESSEAIPYSVTFPTNYTGSSFKNTAKVTATPIDTITKKPITGKVSDTDDHTVLIPSFVTTKVADKEVYVVGETVTYTITVTNTGQVALKNVAVSDPTIGFTTPEVISEIGIGESASVEFQYVIPTGIKPEFTNIATVCLPAESTATVVDQNGTTASSSTTKAPEMCKHPEEVIEIAQIQLIKTADKTKASVGDKVVYTFEVLNTGNVAVDPTMLTDDILGEIGDPGVIEPGKSEKLTKEFTVPDTAKVGDVIKNTATVCAPIPDDALGSSSSTTSTTAASTTTSTTSSSTGIMPTTTTTPDTSANTGITETASVTSACDKANVGKGECPDPIDSQTLCDQDQHELTVVAPPTIADVVKGAVQTSLPFTGSMAEMITKSALWIIAIGGIALFFTRNKKRSSKNDDLLARLNS